MKKSFVISIIFLASALFAAAQNRVIIRAAAEATIEGEIVRLGDLAEMSGDGQKTKRLKSISLGYAPNVGMMREISRRQISLAIAAAGFAEGDFVLDAPDKILIRRAGQTISRAQILRAVENHLSAKMANETLTAAIMRFDAPESITAPQGAVEIRPNFAAVQNLFQPFSLPVEIVIDGKTWRRISINTGIEAFAEVLVAARDLTVNSKISEGDVVLDKRRLVKPLGSYLRDAAKLRGFVLVKNISGGAEITLDSFVSGVVVKAGDAVRIEAQSGKLKIVVSGEARNAGRIGDRIAVKNLQSGAILQAVVVDEGLVKINF